MVRKTSNAVLLLSCSDQKGLVATLADFIYSHKGNIVQADLRADVEAFGVGFACVSCGHGGWERADQECAVLQELETHQVDVVVLARYMQVLSEDFLSCYPNRIINIHHPLLPAFVGARPYHQAYERGVKIIGATAHYATAALDQGPIIEQDVVGISHRDSVADLVGKSKDIEKAVLARAISLHLHNCVMV